jgi:putative transposase
LKTSKFSEDQIVRILGEVRAGKSVREVCKAHGVSENSYYIWRRKYAGMETGDVKRLRELEAENSALKRIVANQAFEIDAVKVDCCVPLAGNCSLSDWDTCCDRWLGNLFEAGQLMHMECALASKGKPTDRTINKDGLITSAT